MAMISGAQPPSAPCSNNRAGSIEPGSELDSIFVEGTLRITPLNRVNQVPEGYRFRDALKQATDSYRGPVVVDLSSFLAFDNSPGVSIDVLTALKEIAGPISQRGGVLGVLGVGERYARDVFSADPLVAKLLAFAPDWETLLVRMDALRKHFDGGAASSR